MINQILSMTGAILILAAYFALQRGWLGREDRSYYALNFVGSTLLTIVAIDDRRAGFIVVEGAWALLSMPGMFKPPAAPAAHEA